MPLEDSYNVSAEHKIHVVGNNYADVLEKAEIMADEFWKDTPYRLQILDTHRVDKERAYSYTPKATETTPEPKTQTGVAHEVEFHAQVRTWTFSGNYEVE